jgi:hypothetical protein
LSRYTLKEVLKDTHLDWDHDGTLQNIRETFWKVINCGTEVLGAEIYASDSQERIVYHTCKSPLCPAVELDLPPSGKRRSRLHFRRFRTLKSISQCPRCSGRSFNGIDAS